MEYINFLKTSEKNLIDQWLDQVDQLYAIGQSGLSDTVYDNLIEIYESRFGKRTKIGSLPVDNKIELPIAMMSLDKIKTEKELLSFLNKNSNPYIIMDKINGNAGLYEIINNKPKLYNRGDGTIGSDLSHILPYLNLPVLPFNVHVKGELVINKSDYELFVNDYKTNLAMINGLLNSKSSDPNKLKLFKFIAYDMSFPDNKDIELKMSETLSYLEKYKFQVPYYISMDNPEISKLSDIFKTRKKDAEYDVDGLVIVSDVKIKYTERLIRENPKYAVAFKEYGDTAEVIVESIVWKGSKRKRMKPKVKINPPVKIDSFTIKSLTGFNAGWIRDNKVGKGTKLLITRNTVPHILNAIEGTEADLPDYPEDWYWNETNVDILLKEDNDEVRIARIYEFFEKIGAKYLGEAMLSKLYYGGFDTIKKILESSKHEFLEKKIDGIGEGIIDRMMNSISGSLTKVTLVDIMSAGGMFGLGFGTKKINAILKVYPNILDIEITKDDIIKIDGFGDKTAERFIQGLPKFKHFLEHNPILKQALIDNNNQNNNNQKIQKIQKLGIKIGEINKDEIKTGENITGENISGKSIVFTGFRDKSLEQEIVKRGGQVKTGVSKKVDYVVVGGAKGQGSSKENKAMELGIPILNLEEFKNKFGF